jgi:hypothetical protein
MATARVSVDHAIVRQHVERIGNHLAWHGAFFIDYFFDRESGRPEYIEANPRIGETVNAMLGGLNLPKLLVRISLGESPRRAPLGRLGIRTHNAMMIQMSAAHSGEGRVALLREMHQCFLKRGLYQNSRDELTRPGDDAASFLPWLGTTIEYLTWPRLARRTVSGTVRNYSLPEATTEQIKALPLDLLNNEF